MFNNLAFEQVTVETQGMSADRSTGGVQMNIIPKDGGNQFSGTVRTIHTAPSWQADNITDELRARGLASTPAVKKHYDTRLRASAARSSATGCGSSARRAGRSTSSTSRGTTTTGCRGRSSTSRIRRASRTATTTSRTTACGSRGRRRRSTRSSPRSTAAQPVPVRPARDVGGPLAAPEAVGAHDYGPNALPLLTWTYTASNQLLIEAGASANIFYNNTKRRPEVDSQTIQVTDTLRNYRYGSRATGVGHAGGYRVQFNEQYHQQLSASYMTGAHNFKVGFNYDLYVEGKPDRANDANQINQARSYTFRGTTPLSVTIWAVPRDPAAGARHRDVRPGSVDNVRLTLNLGVRFNNFNGSVPETDLPAGPFVPARVIRRGQGLLRTTGTSARASARAYDVFGNGRTAMKVSLGRFNP